MSAAPEHDNRETLAELAQRLGMAEAVVSELVAHQFLPWPDPDGLYHPEDVDAAVAQAGGPQGLVQAASLIARAPHDPLAARMRAGLERLAENRDWYAAHAAQIEYEHERDLQRLYDENAALKDRLAKAQTARAPQRDKLAGLALSGDVELSHFDGEVFATVPENGHIETVKLRSRAFRLWLSRRYYEATKSAAGGEGLNDAILALEGKARAEGIERPVYVRLAESGGRIYLDLGRADWRVVEIGAEGWRVIEAADAPVRFIRPRGVRALPIPEQGGQLKHLTRYVNVKPADMVLVYAWLVAAFRPRGPFPILALSSEQGAGKSTVTRVLRALVDPNAAAIRTLPREELDLLLSAKNGWVVALDNVSSIPPWLADAICRLATGGGFGARQRYTDDEETLFEAQRPAILNGIGELAARPDLGDRSLIVRLPTIPEDEREPESTFWADFEDDWPLLLGAVLDAVAGALSRIDATHLERIPRMADFALWAQAAEQGLPVPPGSFMEAYADNRAGLTQAAVEDDPFIAEVDAFARERGEWEGTASELLTAIKSRWGDNPPAVRGVPKAPNAVSNKLNRFMPALRAVGVHIEIGRKPGAERGRRFITVKHQHIA